MVSTVLADVSWVYGAGAVLTFVTVGIRALSLSDMNRSSEILPLPESIALVAMWPVAFIVAVLLGVVGIARHGVDRSIPDADSSKNLRHLSRKQAAALAYDTRRLELARALNDENERTTRFILGATEHQPAIETKPGEWVRGR